MGGAPQGLGGTPPLGPIFLQRARDPGVPHAIFFNDFSLLFWYRFWSLSGRSWAPFGTYFGFIFGLKILLLSALISQLTVRHNQKPLGQL